LLILLRFLDRCQSFAGRAGVVKMERPQPAFFAGEDERS
jgi:hypothetical protein